MVLRWEDHIFGTQLSFMQHFCHMIRKANAVSRPTIIRHEFRTIELIEHGIHLLRHKVHVHFLKAVKGRVIVHRLARWLPQRRRL